MRINFVHLREPAANGGYIDFAVFDANATTGRDEDRDILLSDLTMKARLGMQLKVDVSALAYSEHGQIRFYGDKTVVDYLKNGGVPGWTHYMDV